MQFLFLTIISFFLISVFKVCSFLLQLHVVHYNSELYPNMSAAMTQRDGLAVLGILIVVNKHNAHYHTRRVMVSHYNIHGPEFCFPRQVRRRTRHTTTSSTT